MDIYSLMSSNCAALAGDSQLQADAQIWYGRPLSVFIDQDKDNPPEAGDDSGSTSPSIQLHSWHWRASEENRRVTSGYDLLITVADPDDAVRADAVVELSGTARLNAIIRRAIAVIRQDAGDDIVMAVEYETDTIGYFPVMVAGVSIEFNIDLLIGQDPLD
jgi:hypothetical protein